MEVVLGLLRACSEVAHDHYLHLIRDHRQRHDCRVDRARRVDGGEPEGWRGRVARCTLIEAEAVEAAKQGLQ
jgi:hypothetical protein